MLLTARTQLVILAGFDHAEADDADADQHDRRQHQRRKLAQGSHAAEDHGQHGDQCAGGIADRRRNGQLDIAQTDIADGHGDDVKQGDGQIRPDDVQGDLDAAEEDLISGVQTHHDADGDDHFQMRGLVLFAAAADFREEIGAAPEEQRDQRCKKPVHFCSSSGRFVNPASTSFCSESRMPSLA